MFTLIKQFLFLLMLTLVTSQITYADNLKTMNSQRLQATYSHKFLKFVSWGSNANAPNFVFCVLSSDNYFGNAWAYLNDKKVAQGTISVQYFTTAPANHQLLRCNGVYVDSLFPYQGLKKLLASTSMLTIVQEDIAAKDIGVFIFYQNGHKLEFKVSLSVARSKGIQVDTSLLLLAKEVIR